MRRVIFLRQHDGEAFRCRDKKVRRLTSKFCALARRSVAGAQVNEQILFQAHADNRRAQDFSQCHKRARATERRRCIARRGERLIVDFPEQEIENAEKTSERFAAAGRRSEKDRLAVENRRARSATARR